MKIKKIMQLSIIKTIKFNIYYFGIKGLKFPCLISKNTKLEKLSGKVILKNCGFKSILIGFGPIQASNDKGRWYNTGLVEFEKEAHLYSGFFLYNNGSIKLGENFRLAASKIFCEKEIEIGKDTMISWDCILCDSDLHNIYQNNKRINKDKKIEIGNHVWICSYCHIFKGTKIYSNNIIASDTHLSNIVLKDENCIYGNHGKKLKNKIEWAWELGENNFNR